MDPDQFLEGGEEMETSCTVYITPGICNAIGFNSSEGSFPGNSVCVFMASVSAGSE